MENPTIIVGHLNNEELQKSIDTLVTKVDEGMKLIVKNTNTAVNAMEEKLKSLGGIKFDGGGSANGGSSKKAVDAINSVIAAQDKQIKKNQEATMSFDQMAAAQQKAVQSQSMPRNSIETLNNLRAQLQFIESEKAKAAKNFGSLFAMPYDQQADAIRAKIREITQGVSVANSEQKQVTTSVQQTTKATEQQVQAQQQATQSAQRYTEEIRKQADEIRKSQQWREKGFVTINGRDIYNLEGADTPRKNRISLENQLLALQQQQRRETEATAQEKAKVVSQDERDLQIMGSQAETLRRSREILREMQAQKGGKVETFTPQLESAKRLSEKLKELREQYNNMTFGQRMSADGQRIAQGIREITRQTQKMNAELSRPANLSNALSLPAKSLDDIAYKMQQLRAYMRGLDMSNAKSANEVRTVTAAMEELKRKENELLGKQAQLFGSNNALARSWNYMKNRLAFYFTIGASTQFVRNLIEVRSQYEMNERALGILINSAERGTQTFNELSQMALVSPYTLIELSDAAKQLTAYDIAAKDVVDTTRRLADISAAVGVPVERFTYALGQVKAFGHLTSQDARQFLNTGVPLVKELAKHYTELEGRLVSTADVYDRMKKHAVSYNDVVLVLNQMTDEGGKFFDYQAKMADTLKVQLANLTLAWNNMLNDIGESNQWLLSGSIGALKDLFLQWGTINRVIYDAAIVFGIAKAAQLALNFALGKGVASVEATILANKRRMATELERKALTQTLTVEEQRLLATRKLITAADYQQMLASKSLTKQQAMLLYVMRGRNAELGAALIRMNILTAAELKNITVTKLFTAAMRSAWISIKGLASSLAAAFPALAVTTAIFSIVDAIQYYNDQSEKTVAMNKAIADNAREASKAIGEFISDSVNAVNRQKALEGKLSSSDADKTWEALREQIELSSAASSVFIAKLLEEEDINKRIGEGFTVAEKIRDATAAMAELGETAFEVSQDSWLNGFFGEGLAEDLEDYIEEIKELREEAETRGIGDNAVQLQLSNKQVTKEAYAEMEAFADDVAELLREQLGDAGVGDPVKLKEAVERIKKEVKAANPQIKGEVAKFFDVEVDVLMAKKFEGVYDKTASLHKMLIDHIKRDSGAALANLSDDILDTSKALDDDIAEAIEKSFKKLHEELPPEMDSLLSEMQKELDSNPLQVRYLLMEAGDIKSRDAIQKDFDEHFIDNVAGEKPSRPTWNVKESFAKHQEEMEAYQKSLSDWQTKRSAQAAKFSEFNKKDGEDRVKWAKRLNDVIKDENAKRTAALHTMQEVRKELGAHLTLEQLLKDARYKAASDDAAAAKERMDNAKAVYDYEKLYNEEKKKNKGRGSQKDPLLDTLKQVVDIIKKTQSEFDTLTQKGMASGDALQNVYGRYSKTLTFINKQLAHYGLPQVDLSKIIKGKNPNDALEFLQQLSTALTNKGLSKLERQKTIEVAIQEFSLKAQTFNLDKITKGLNSELGKLKEEYELAVELDANPEMGNLFADWMGIDMSSLPHTAEEYAKRMTEALNKYLAEEKSGIEIGNLLALTDDDLRMFQQRVDNKELNQVWIDEIVKDTKEARNALKKENSGIAKEWDSLVQKYSEYEYKIAQIQRNANNERKTFALKYGSEEQKERAIVLTTKIVIEKDQAKKQELINQLKKLLADIAGDDDAKLKIKVAIDEKELQESAKLAFEEFQKSPDWIIATGELSGMTQKALHGLIEEIEEYKKKAKHLDPKSIQKINRTLRNLHKQVRKGNPFAAIIDVFDRAKERAEEYDAEIKEVSKSIADLTLKQQEKGELTDEENKKLGKLQATLQKLEKKKKEVGKVSATELVSGISDAVNIAQQGIKVFGELFAAIGGEGSKASQTLKDINTVMDKAMSGAAVGASIGQGWGAIIGAVAGAATGLIEVISQASDRRITEKIEESENAVKRLENAYKHLEEAIENAFGASVIGAKQAAIANKELQLEELKKQLRLEKSRDEKDRDQGKIEDLAGQIIDLQYEIEHAYKEIGNSLLGISSVAEAAQTMMNAYIEALRSGEDAMGGFNESVNDMIANLIKQIFVTRVIAPQLEKIMDDFNEKITQRSQAKAKEYEKAVNYLNSIPTLPNSFTGNASEYLKYRQQREFFNSKREAAAREVERLKKELESISTPNRGDVRELTYALRSIEPELASQTQEMLDWLNEFGLMKTSSKDNLSNLQQGIQGITESTAEAIEAYMNSVSQQVYLHSDILTQIRDTVVGFDMETQLGIQSQMLLQLQNNYIVMQSMQSMMEGWTTPSGSGIRVELMS